MKQGVQHHKPPQSSVEPSISAHEKMYNLLRAFDSVCNEGGITYFLIGDTLIGAVVYQDLIPDEQSSVTVGMLREEYEKLVRAINFNTILQVHSEDPFRATFSLAREVDSENVLHVHVFDWMPADYDLRKFHVARITVWRKLLNSPLRLAALRRISRIAKYYNKDNSEEVVHLSLGERHYIPAEAITSLQYLTVGPLCLPAPCNMSFWIEQDRYEEARRIKSVQADCLSIMKEIDRVCRAHSIGYFMCAGTLLGSMRYGGYIPWDDDIDIAMLRADYDHFLSVAPDAFSEDFFLQAPHTDPNSPYLYAKVRLNGTEYVTSYTQYRSSHQGISVDIFPFDLAPSDDADLAAYNKETQERYVRFKDVARRRAVAFPKMRPQVRPLEHIGRIIMSIRRRQYDSASLAQARDTYENHVTKYNNGIAAFNRVAASGDYTHIVYNLIDYINVEIDDLLPLQEMPFEELTLYGPHNPNAFMREWFGDDYMQEPPVHRQLAHPVVRWKTRT